MQATLKAVRMLKKILIYDPTIKDIIKNKYKKIIQRNTHKTCNHHRTSDEAVPAQPIMLTASWELHLAHSVIGHFIHYYNTILVRTLVALMDDDESLRRHEELCQKVLKFSKTSFSFAMCLVLYWL